MHSPANQPANSHSPPGLSNATRPQGMDVIASVPTAPSNEASTTTSPTQGARSTCWINRNFALLWGGQALSILGNTVFTTTLVVWIASQLAMGQAWAPLVVSGVVLAAAIPALLLGPFAGVFVDRIERRRIMLAMDGSRAILSAVLIFSTGVIPLPLAPNGRLPLSWTLGAIYAIVFLMNAADLFFGSAMLALISNLVQEKEQPKAMGLRQASVSLATIVGPALALFALIGLFITGVNVAAGPLMRRATPRALVGRVNSIIAPAMSASILIGTASGWVSRQRDLARLTCCHCRHNLRPG